MASGLKKVQVEWEDRSRHSSQLTDQRTDLDIPARWLQALLQAGHEVALYRVAGGKTPVVIQVTMEA